MGNVLSMCCPQDRPDKEKPLLQTDVERPSGNPQDTAAPQVQQVEVFTANPLVEVPAQAAAKPEAPVKEPGTPPALQAATPEVNTSPHNISPATNNSSPAKPAGDVASAPQPQSKSNSPAGKAAADQAATAPPVEPSVHEEKQALATTASSGGAPAASGSPGVKGATPAADAKPSSSGGAPAASDLPADAPVQAEPAAQEAKAATGDDGEGDEDKPMAGGGAPSSSAAAGNDDGKKKKNKKKGKK